MKIFETEMKVVMAAANENALRAYNAARAANARSIWRCARLLGNR